MKLLKYTLAILVFSLVVFACRKEQSSEGGEIPGTDDEQWEFTESGTTQKGPMDSAYVQTIGSVTTISMVGSTTPDKQGELFLQIVADSLTIGSYTNPLVFMQYTESAGVLFQSSPVQTDAFTINITELDSTSVAGTFSGKVFDADNNEHNITDGKFRTKITSWEKEPDPITSGQLTVWTREICNDGTGVEIRIGDQSIILQDGLTEEPECGAAGTAVFELQSGNYTVEAICGTDTLRYDVDISDRCSILEIDFANPPVLDDYLPLITGSYWDYADLADGTRTHRITSDGQEAIDNRMFTRFVSTLGDTFYFRKEDNVYYEYVKLDFQNVVDDPPAIEMVILYDDLSAGESWETPSEDITLSGVPVKVKLVSKINRRDFSATFNGVTYSDLIEVNTELYFSSNGGASYQASGSAYNRIYAKGKGIVYYYDVNRDTEWAISGLSLNP